MSTSILKGNLGFGETSCEEKRDKKYKQEKKFQDENKRRRSEEVKNMFKRFPQNKKRTSRFDCWCVGHNLLERRSYKVKWRNKKKKRIIERDWNVRLVSLFYHRKKGILFITHGLTGRLSLIPVVVACETIPKNPRSLKTVSRLRHQSTRITWCRNRRRSADVGCCTWAVRCLDRARTACRAFRSRCAASTRSKVPARRKASTVGWASGRTESYWRMSTRTGSRSRGSFRSTRCTIARLFVKCWFQSVATLIRSRNFCRSTRHSLERLAFNIRQSLRPFSDAPPALRCSSVTRSYASAKRPPTL